MPRPWRNGKGDPTSIWHLPVRGKNSGPGRLRQPTASRKDWCAYFPNWSPAIPSLSGSSRGVLLSTPPGASALHIYYYYMDREFGLIHVMVQTWFPMRMQVFVNGHHWVANKLTANGIKFSQCENVFLWIEDVQRAQRFADRLTSVNWPLVLNRYARKSIR